jgi:hypothetical protein
MRILLDTNVWRYIVDYGALGVVHQAARRSRHDIVIAPSVVYEALRTRDEVLRKSLVCAMTLPYWKRLMPEAFSEAQEIKSEVERLRPEWLNWAREISLYQRLRHDWTRSRGGFWDRARSDTLRESQRIDTLGLLDIARNSSRQAREIGKNMPAGWRTRPFSDIKASLPEPAPGWNGEPFEWWRAEARENFKLAMTRIGHPYAEWLNGEINLAMMTLHASDLTHFWLHETEATRMPRHWLRSAFEFQQQFHKVNDGTPCDTQLGTYLVDVDLMLSADKNFVKFAERCRREAPFPMGRSSLIPGGSHAVEVLLEELRNKENTVGRL